MYYKTESSDIDYFDNTSNISSKPILLKKRYSDKWYIFFQLFAITCTIFYFTLPVLRIDKTDKMREITHMKKIISDIRSKENCKIKIIFYIIHFYIKNFWKKESKNADLINMKIKYQHGTLYFSVSKTTRKQRKKIIRFFF